MHSVEVADQNGALGRLILQELMNLRNDLKDEMKRLGDRLERCMTLHMLTCPRNLSFGSNLLSSCNTNLAASGDVSSDGYFQNKCAVPVSLVHPGTSDVINDVERQSASHYKDRKNMQNFVCSDEEKSKNFRSDDPEAIGNDLVSNDYNSLTIQKTTFPIVAKVDDVLPESSLTNVAVIPRVPSSEKCKNVAKRVCSALSNAPSSTCVMSSISSSTYTASPTSSGGKHYQCPTCLKYFFSSGSLASHKRIHTESKRFKCSLCLAAFRRKLDLQRHVRIHTGESPYSCSECGKRFSRTDALKSHLKVHQKRM